MSFYLPSIVHTTRTTPKARDTGTTTQTVRRPRRLTPALRLSLLPQAPERWSVEGKSATASQPRVARAEGFASVAAHRPTVAAQYAATFARAETFTNTNGVKVSVDDTSRSPALPPPAAAVAMIGDILGSHLNTQAVLSP